MMKTFSPASMGKSHLTFESAYLSNAPTLTYVDIAYGKGSAIMWLAQYIARTFGVCGFIKEYVTDFMIENTARVIFDTYYYLKLPELALFFNLFEVGKYNVFHGHPNPQVITSSLSDFCRERSSYASRLESNKRMEETIAMMSDKNLMTYEQYAAKKKAEGKELNIEMKDGTFYLKEKENEKGRDN